MKTIITILTFSWTILLLPIISFGQTLISGQLVDSLTRKPVEFANIGIISKSFGTTSDENGNYKLLIPDSLINENIKFSIIGYVDKSISIKVLSKTKQIFLKQSSINLNEVVVVPKKEPILQTIGNKTSTKNVMTGFITNSLGSELGIELNIKHKDTKIKKVLFNIIANPFDSLIFRLNIYKLDKNNTPTENLLQKNIITHQISKIGLIEIDINDCNIFTSENVLISIEWIKDFGDNKGLWFSSKMMSGKTYYRKTSQDSWKKTGSISMGLWAEIEN